jgi:transcriptional regulator with XRE-family HTH domain
MWHDALRTTTTRLDEGTLINKRRLAFGDALRELRETAGFRTGREFAAALGWQPSKVSRIETGTTLPTDADVIAWATAAGAAPHATEAVRDQLRDLRVARSGRSPRRAGTNIRRVATHLVEVDFFLMPGLVQTAEYARAVAASTTRRAALPTDTDRIRRQEVLYDPEKRIEVLVGEPALRYPIAAPPVLAGQLDRLAGLAGLPNLRLGIVPWDVPLPIASPHGYALLDDEVVLSANHGELVLTDAADVEVYREITEALWKIALAGDQARASLAKASAALVS